MRTLLIALVVLSSMVGCRKPTADELIQQGIDAQKENKPDVALGSYQDFLKTYPQSPRVPEALYAQAHIYQNDKKDFGKAIEIYRRIVNEFPQHATASSASFLIGFIYNNDLKDTAAARVAYQEYLQKYPNTPMASSAKFELDNLGKDPAELLQSKLQVAERDVKKTSSKKK